MKIALLRLVFALLIISVPAITVYAKDNKTDSSPVTQEPQKDTKEVLELKIALIQERLEKLQLQFKLTQDELTKVKAEYKTLMANEKAEGVKNAGASID